MRFEVEVRKVDDHTKRNAARRLKSMERAANCGTKPKQYTLLQLRIG
jgi:hypothetical protein